MPDADSCESTASRLAGKACSNFWKPCQSLFVAPCSHVWHYKCIRPILNDHKTWPQFLCPNCRAVTDLEADVDDPEEEAWEDDLNSGSSPDFNGGLNSAHATNGSIPEHDEMSIDGDDEALSTTTSRVLSIKDDTQPTPSLNTASDPTNGANASPNLLIRRGARRILPPSQPAGEQSATRSPSGQVQFLRPITPTQPLMGNDDLNESSLRTPMTDMLIHDGPMTPTNNAGPFVFDGSAGRAGRNLSENTDNNSSDA